MKDFNRTRKRRQHLSPSRVQYCFTAPVRGACCLSSKITAAAQYRLQFVAQSGRVTAIHDSVLLLDGIPRRELIHPIGIASARAILDITSVGPEVVFEGCFEGAEAATILL